MYFNQITVPGLGCQSYVVGCPAAKVMAVVDPKRDIADYLEIARSEGMRITHIINTHLHADHVSGDQELRAVTGAKIYINDSVPIDYVHEGLSDGDVFVLGAARIEVLHTPGHTPNSVSLLVTDTARSDEPEMLLTGDLLFVGDTGRPDLAGEDLIAQQVQNLYTSLYEKFAAFPDYLEVYPAHGQGTLCGKGLSAKKSSTLGYERRANRMLRFSSFEEFKKDVTSSYPARPKSYGHIIETNRKGAPLLDTCPMDKRLEPAQFEELMREGAVVIDTRDAASFGGFHIPDSINIGFEKQLANWVGMVVEPDADILLVTDGREGYDRMTCELHRIGYDRIFGYLSGGVSSWLMSGRPVAQLGQTSPHQLADELKGKAAPVVVDVRTPAEWEAGRIAGAVHFPLTAMLEGRFPDLGKDADVVAQCGSGYRSNIAGSLMRQAGFSHVRSLAGGFFAWRGAGLPVSS
ncbi:Rhodanese-like protein [Desulfovibrio sp. X2]|uniref:MBL fold metallo-hydrolase n=1 Tax=Desulfovibrio sp. X2 TaxID=941449 RepID=UPI00035874F4|nr:rhodanese-like domain-containing protein [Desulfovibrio sp. X2]EPR43519.1 Rhodanese-like protein [Desulfovibrio sp. X2]